MGRRSVVKKSTLNLTAPNYAALSEAIDDFQEEERLFYKRRAEELSEYPGVGNKTKAEVEKDYDDLLGDDPWDYMKEFNNANNDEKSDSDQTDATTGFNGEDADSFYIILPDKLAEREGSPDETDSASGDKFILYNPGTGYAEVDLLYTNVSFFKSKGSSGTFGNSRSGYTQTYYEGFDELPVRYKDNNKMDGRIAHMKRLIGTLWDDQVKPYWDDYEDALDDYNQYVGGGVDTNIYGGTVPNEDKPWDGLTNDFDGYNRIDELEEALINEARGHN